MSRATRLSHKGGAVDRCAWCGRIAWIQQHGNAYLVADFHGQETWHPEAAEAIGSFADITRLHALTHKFARPS